jgi:hypothetical protein
MEKIGQQYSSYSTCGTRSVTDGHGGSPIRKVTKKGSKKPQINGQTIQEQDKHWSKNIDRKLKIEQFKPSTIYI